MLNDQEQKAFEELISSMDSNKMVARAEKPIRIRFVLGAVSLLVGLIGAVAVFSVSIISAIVFIAIAFAGLIVLTSIYKKRQTTRHNRSLSEKFSLGVDNISERFTNRLNPSRTPPNKNEN